MDSRYIFHVLDFGLYMRFFSQVWKFRKFAGHLPRIALPKTYHEKMLWRKIFDHNPDFIRFCDKLAAKTYIHERLPDLLIPETLWAGPTLADAPAGLITDPDVVIKTNHGCSFNYFPAREQLNTQQLIRRFDRWMAQTYGRRFHEWGYFGVARTIFAERLVPCAGGALLDISIECADGVVIYGYITIRNKTAEQKLNNYASDGTPISLAGKYRAATYRLPDELDVRESFLIAVDAAARLSRGLDYARIDFLSNGAQVYAGEITIYPMAGLFTPTPAGQAGTDTLVNPHWDLRKSWFLTAPQRGWKKYYARLLNGALSS
jgi:hypothetical protein